MKQKALQAGWPGALQRVLRSIQAEIRMPEGLRTGSQVQARHKTDILQSPDGSIGTSRQLEPGLRGVKSKKDMDTYPIQWIWDTGGTNPQRTQSLNLEPRQTHTRLDAFTSSHSTGKASTTGKQKQQNEKSVSVNATTYKYRVGAPCYALYFGPKWIKNGRWILAIAVKVYGTRSINVRVLPRGPTWWVHDDQLRPPFGADQDKDPKDDAAKIQSAQFGQQPMVL